ncbi:MAG: GNAT family N-acetyltransferase [Thermoleophilia bacterium]|nr:GNAT family N-acetyltransferase [Thermoleophilia bacterium]
MDCRAELIGDRGEAASSADFFRSPRFLEAEGTTHSLRITGGDDGTVELAAPLVVRDIPDSDRFDAISPYGYPGLRLTGPGGSGPGRSAPDGPPGIPVDPGEIDFSGTGLVTVFLRHALGRPIPLTGASPRNICLLSDPDLPRKSRMSDRQQIRKNLKNGYEMKLVAGPDSGSDARAGFFTAYTETMRRTDAAERYFFEAGYFDRILGADGTWLVSARAPDGGIAAASIAVLSDGLLHYYLSGTADRYLRDSAMKNVIEAMISFGDETGLAVNLGGGITPGDPLEEFKRGFANREEQWYTSEIVCDGDACAELTVAGDPGGFFPPYRA